MNTSAWKKAIFFFCCLCCITAILGSADFAFSHIDHSCMGSGCPACAQLQETVKLLRFFGVSLIFVLFAAAFKRIAAYGASFIIVIPPFLTGILLKVRFNT
jgi:hypothetical protein